MIKKSNAVAVIVGLLISLMAVVVYAGENGYSTFFWKSYGQWLESQDSMPLEKKGLIDCNLARKDAVWFLAGAGLRLNGISVEHECAMRRGKHLFFPLVNTVFYNAPASSEPDFDYALDRFADVQILRYQVPGLELLTLKQKKLVYYLSMAGLGGQDIIWDQNYKHNLRIRRTLEAIIGSFEGERSSAEFGQFMNYAKQVWYMSGIHHHYSSEKILPQFSSEYFAKLIRGSSSGALPLLEGET